MDTEGGGALAPPPIRDDFRVVEGHRRQDLGIEEDHVFRVAAGAQLAAEGFEGVGHGHGVASRITRGMSSTGTTVPARGLGINPRGPNTRPRRPTLPITS